MTISFGKFVRNLYIFMVFFMLITIGYVKNIDMTIGYVKNIDMTITWIISFVIIAYTILVIDESEIVYKELLLRR